MLHGLRLPRRVRLDAQGRRRHGQPQVPPWARCSCAASADPLNNDYGKTDYYNDPTALKLISQTDWDADRPLYDVLNDDVPIAPQRAGWFVRAQRTRNYIRRMVPHIFGWFPMTSVWFWLFTQLENAKRDVAEVSDREIPVWVNAVIVGTFMIFMSFAFVRDRF